MTLVIQQMHPNDAGSFLEVHHAAVRVLAAKDYPSIILESWAPLPVTDEAIERFLRNPDDEVRLVAEADGAIVGVGALVLSKSELRACYVSPTAIRRGVGSAIVHEIEAIAREHGLSQLDLDASVTAEPFYAVLGYEVCARGEHILRSGEAMACVKMRKRL